LPKDRYEEFFLYPGQSGSLNMMYRTIAVFAMVGVAMLVFVASFIDDVESLLGLMLVMLFYFLVVVAIALLRVDWPTMRLLWSIGPSCYQFAVPASWPVDGLMRHAVERLAARGFTVFPMAKEFLKLPPSVESRVRYGYVINPLGRQLLVLNCHILDNPRRSVPVAKEYYRIIVRPFDSGTSPGDDPVVSTIGALLLEFECVRVRKGYPASIGRTGWLMRTA